MSLVNFHNRQGLLLTPTPNAPEFSSLTTNATLNAAGESVAAVGRICLSTGAGTSKVISAAGGGKIFWYSATVTWANVATNLRVGIQDVAATGLEDTTFDVYKDLVPGTDTITANTINSATMGSGTKTIAHGDLIAVVFEMTARGGTDSVLIQKFSAPNSIMPYSTLDTGAGPSKNDEIPSVTILFDDGTVGWFTLDSAAHEVTSASINSGSTPDEAALVFRLPVPFEISALYARLGLIAATDDFELLLYSDPYGTPAVEKTITVDADLTASSGAASSPFEAPLASVFQGAANTWYAVAFRPTTTNNANFYYLGYGTEGATLKLATMLGLNWMYATRTNQTGAFVDNANRLPLLGFRISKLDDGTGGGGGGGEVSHTFLG